MAKILMENQEECFSGGLGVEVCLEVFRLNDHDLSEVHHPAGAIREAIDGCPVPCLPWECA